LVAGTSHHTGWYWDKVNHYANLPFAKPPGITFHVYTEDKVYDDLWLWWYAIVGDLRFQSPQVFTDIWNETRQFNGPILPICPQLKFTDKFFIGTPLRINFSLAFPSSTQNFLPHFFVLILMHRPR
jgi:hypothetical protein